MGKASYDSDGKRAFRALLLELARRDGLRTYGTLWGSGIDSRLFAAAGFDVTAAEMKQALHEEMRADAEAHGYSAFCGNAKRLDQRFDMFHADFCGTASPRNFEALRAISEKVDRWLAVTLSPDHQLDSSMQGEAGIYTVPAWLHGATDNDEDLDRFTLVYFAPYERNGFGQRMYCGVMGRLPDRKGGNVRGYVAPHRIAITIAKRGYWASDWFHHEYSGLLPHRDRYAIRKPSTRARLAAKQRARWAAMSPDERHAEAAMLYAKRKAKAA